MKDLNVQKKVLIIGIVLLVIILIGSTYAFFTYSKTRGAFSLTSGSITSSLEDGNNNISISYGYPISDSFAIQNLDKLDYMDFTVNGNSSDSNTSIGYEIYLTKNSGSTLDENHIKVYLTDNNNEEIVKPAIYNGLEKATYKGVNNGKIIYQNIESGSFSHQYRLYAWIDSTYSQNEVHQTFSFKVNLYAYNTTASIKGHQLVKDQIKKYTTLGSVAPTIEDDEQTIYFSGKEENVNFNYVWYSGKLWRIVAIYKDGTMKLITEETVAAIPWGNELIYYDDETKTGAWIYQFLNEDFLDTLYNYQEILVTDYKWNITKEENPEPLKDVKATETLVSAPVGSIDVYEYYQSYKNATEGQLASYLKSGGMSWWLMNPASDTEVWSIDAEIGLEKRNVTSSDKALVVRPTIVLRADVELTGTGDDLGTKNNPYTIKNDKAKGKANEKLNTRLSGEYLTLEDNIYRIINADTSGPTKIVMETPIPHVKVHFGDDTDWKKSVESENEDYVGYYLNHVFLTESLKNYLVEGPFYYGKIGKSDSYKNGICKEENTTATTKDCEKTESVWNGYVGIPQIGEMFSLTAGRYTWLINPRGYDWCWSSGDDGRLGNYYPNGHDERNIRPTMFLNSNIIITEGEGTLQKPYQIALPN